MEILHHNVKQFPLFKQPLSRLLLFNIRWAARPARAALGEGRGAGGHGMVSSEGTPGQRALGRRWRPPGPGPCASRVLPLAAHV